MSAGSKNKNLLVIIAVLFLTNIAVLGYFLWYKKPHREQHSNNRDRNVVGDMLKKDVGFDTIQITSYREMRQKQQDVLRPMFDDMRKSKDSLFSLIGKTQPEDSLVQVLAARIGEKQKALDLQTFRYFSDLRKLCRPDQQAKYDTLMSRMFKRMGRKGNNK